ncbi:branched-chain amino acid ABC transporter permease [Billgrantia diversa]|uniref:branched-chain amino acid ABC transporter permease n=1 Tax=Halomonas sp. MCCC 1A13316 TaxID=2733487 RepID=UPI0018A635CF|nr:branched-chain amino acid ABC transporter permease [Halomonas sp. MCCC 1A13316]QOR37899.1 branched-chain amino acid ABC transporter permease [Halomonas sp. MCCC 1A13316]
MTMIFGVPLAVFMGQLLLGLINGAFYALLSLGLAVIFGLLKIVNFAHGAMYMLGAFTTLLGMQYLGINYWAALLLTPLVVGLGGMLVERVLLRRIAHLDHLYGLLLTFGLALIFEGSLVNFFGVSGARYPTPEALQGGYQTGFMFLPKYRAWVLLAAVVICFGTWFIIERTRLGAYLRAGTENPSLMQAFGVNVPLLVTLTYGFGVALAAFAGVLAAPLYPVSPTMGSNLLIVVFAVVVIGGMGSILGAIVTGLAMGLIEGLTKVYYPEAANTVIFLVMILVLLIRPTGLFGKEA